MAKAKKAWFDQEMMWLEFEDGRTLGVPLAWFAGLLSATPEMLARYELSPFGIHWPALDIDLSLAGLLATDVDLASLVAMGRLQDGSGSIEV